MHALDELLVKTRRLVGRIALQQRVDGDEQQAIRIEAQVEPLESFETVNEKSRGGERGDGERCGDRARVRRAIRRSLRTRSITSLH